MAVRPPTPGAPERWQGRLLGGGRSARPGAPAGAGARSIAGQEAGGCGGYSGAPCVRQPCNRRRRAEAKRERVEGGESQQRGSQRAGAAPPGWHRGLERSGARGSEGTSAGACGPGLRGASGPGRGEPLGQPQVVPAKSFCCTSAGKEGWRAFWGVGVFGYLGTRTPRCLFLDVEKGAVKGGGDPALLNEARGWPGGGIPGAARRSISAAGTWAS